MPLKLMYITNRPDVALIAEQNGVDRIFVDMEYIGKAERQRGMDSVKSRHTIEDVKTVRGAVSQAQVLVRVNGQIVQALDSNHNSFPLSFSAEAGTRYHLDFEGQLTEIFRGETLHRTAEYMRKHI